jgi:hypothetical protein
MNQSKKATKALNPMPIPLVPMPDALFLSVPVVWVGALEVVSVEVEARSVDVIGVTGDWAAFCLNCSGVCAKVGLIANTAPCWHNLEAWSKILPETKQMSKALLVTRGKHTR